MDYSKPELRNYFRTIIQLNLKQNPAYLNQWEQTYRNHYNVVITESLGDGTWSYRVNFAGACYLKSRELAEELAKIDLIDRLVADILRGRELMKRFPDFLNNDYGSALPTRKTIAMRAG